MNYNRNKESLVDKSWYVSRKVRQLLYALFGLFFIIAGALVATTPTEPTNWFVLVSWSILGLVAIFYAIYKYYIDVLTIRTYNIKYKKEDRSDN